MLLLSEVAPSGADVTLPAAGVPSAANESKTNPALRSLQIVLPNVVSRGVANDPRADVGLERFAERDLWNIGGGAIYSVLMLAARTTLAHFSVSSAMSSPKSAGEPESTVPPKSANRAFILESARAALISLLSLPMISVGVLLGVQTPVHALAS